MTDAKIKQCAKGFRTGLIGKREGDMMCAMVCYPLAGWLGMMGVHTEIEEVMLQRSNHVFLRLSDGRVLDPTADQFGGPKVYIGEPLWFHRDKDTCPNPAQQVRR
jgi:hypothetical protein